MTDFCTLKSWRYNYKKELQNVFLNHSVKWDGYPPQEGYIRARSFQTGNVTRRREDGKLMLIYLTQSDIKGWIPQYIVNYVTSVGAPEMMKKVVQAALLYPDWMEKNGKKESAHDTLHPDKDPDVVEEYGPEHRF